MKRTVLNIWYNMFTGVNIPSHSGKQFFALHYLSKKILVLELLYDTVHGSYREKYDCYAH